MSKPPQLIKAESVEFPPTAVALASERRFPAFSQADRCQTKYTAAAELDREKSGISTETLSKGRPSQKHQQTRDNE